MPTILCQLLLALLRQQFLRFYYIHYHGSLTLLSSWKMVQASIPQCKLQGKMILKKSLPFFFFLTFGILTVGQLCPVIKGKHKPVIS